jgi:hypothetical protein
MSRLFEQTPQPSAHDGVIVSQQRAQAAPPPMASAMGDESPASCLPC